MKVATHQLQSSIFVNPFGMTRITITDVKRFPKTADPIYSFHLHVFYIEKQITDRNDASAFRRYMPHINMCLSCAADHFITPLRTFEKCLWREPYKNGRAKNTQTRAPQLLIRKRPSDSADSRLTWSKPRLTLVPHIRMLVAGPHQIAWQWQIGRRYKQLRTTHTKWGSGGLGVVRQPAATTTATTSGYKDYLVGWCDASGRQFALCTCDYNSRRPFRYINTFNALPQMRT